MGIAVGVGGRQFQQPRSCPVDRSLVEQMVTVGVGLADARERQRQPDAVEQRGGLGGVEGKDLFRLGGPAVLGDELAAGIVGIQRGQQRATVGAGFGQKRPRHPGFVEIEAEIQKLDGGVGYQIDQRAVILELRQHGSHLRAAFSVGIGCRHFSCIFAFSPEKVGGGGHRHRWPVDRVDPTGDIVEERSPSCQAPTMPDLFGVVRDTRMDS